MRLDLKAIQVTRDGLGYAEAKADQAPSDHRDHQDLSELVVTREPRVTPDQQDRWGQKDPKVPRV